MTNPFKPADDGQVHDTTYWTKHVTKALEELPLPPEEVLPRNAANWAKQRTTTLKGASYAPTGALNQNVAGRRVMSPLQGFGEMWKKPYQVRLHGVQVTPTEVIKVWKENFAKFWPAGNRFFAPLTGIAPGEVALLRITPGGMPLSTGVFVLYSDDESFTLMTPEGHVFAGWITFSAHEENGCTVAQAQVLMRANDPIYELGLRFGGHKQEDVFWDHTLKSLAEHLNVAVPSVDIRTVCIDRKMQWSRAGNILHNSAMYTMLYILTTPVRKIRKQANKKAANK